MIVYAIFLCLALYPDGPHCDRGPEVFESREACEADIRRVWQLPKSPDGRFYHGSDKQWFVCLGKRVEVWK